MCTSQFANFLQRAELGLLNIPWVYMKCWHLRRFGNKGLLVAFGYDTEKKTVFTEGQTGKQIIEQGFLIKVLNLNLLL